MTWTTIRTFNTAQFCVALQCSPEESPDLSWMDGATRAAVARGDYAAYCFRVVVMHDGRIMGADYLGDSIYGDPAEFAREHYGLAPKGRAAGAVYCCYFPALITEACRQARQAITGAPRMRGAA